MTSPELRHAFERAGNTIRTHPAFLLLVLSTAALINSAGLNAAATQNTDAATQNTDTDRDGIPDQQEQALLERFRPTFMISGSDCAVRPAQFKADQADPNVVAADGTIYGQVFPVAESRIEIHYYTLWAKDCGRMKHPLDAEHVSVLLSMNYQGEPEEIYWYAGAHEQTSCDMSSGKRAESPTKGRPVIWSSSVKHALYLHLLIFH